MKRVLLTGVMVVGLAGAAMAAVIYSNGTKINATDKINFKNGPAVTHNGTMADVDFATQTGNQAITGNISVTGKIETNGTIYTAGIIADGGVKPGRATLDPCPTMGPGYIFINDTTGAPCFCNNYSVDLSLYNGTTACF